MKIFSILSILATIAVIAAWCTHVLVCIAHQAYMLLIIGVFVPPIGWLHGVAVWFGFHWI